MNEERTKYGRLTVLDRNQRRVGRPAWLCRCDCGVEKVILRQSILSGGSRSCGCQHVVASRLTHGMSGTTTYRAWLGLVKRCTNPKEPSYPKYGGRGIAVCERWMAFENFLTDMGECPAGLSIDRINNDGNYEPGNCRWATHAQQMRNTSRAILVVVAGETLSLKDCAERAGIDYKTLYAAHRRGVDLAAYIAENRRTA